MSERRACRIAGLQRSTQRYVSRKPSQAPLRMRLRELAMDRPRYGYRRLKTLLKREGWQVSHKRVHRLYCEEWLQVRVKRRKKLAAKPRVKPPIASRTNERWSQAHRAVREVGWSGIDPVSSRTCLQMPSASRSMICFRIHKRLVRPIDPSNCAPRTRWRASWQSTSSVKR